MKLYRKLPVVITAWQVPLQGEESSEELKELVLQKGWKGVDDGVIIPTKEGNMLASAGDIIIRGVAGEFYPCKPEIFKATYEEVKGSKTTVTDVGFNPSGDTMISDLKTAANDMASLIGSLPAGRRRSIALTKLEDASMWAVKAQVVGDA